MTTRLFASCIYTGTVMHRRVRPRRHKLAYEVASFLLDLDELPALDRCVAGFRYNRPGLFSFYDRDHGPGTNTPLRPWVETHLAAAGIALRGGAIRILCYPRTLGYVFNPLSVYFCYRADCGSEILAAVLYQVTNTFHERHTYVIPVADATADGLLRQTCRKAMYVSPFIGLDMVYQFRIKPPAAELGVAINTSDENGLLLFASFGGRRSTLSTASCLKAFLRFPLLTVKVIGGIHWEALKLWLKGVPLVSHPRPPAEPVTIVKANTRIAA